MQDIRTKGVQGNKAVESAPAQTLLAAVPGQFYAVMFGDKDGNAVRCLVLRVGDQWYMPPGSTEYAGALRPLAPWLEKQLVAQAGSSGPLPSQDSVDVLP